MKNIPKKDSGSTNMIKCLISFVNPFFPFPGNFPRIRRQLPLAALKQHARDNVRSENSRMQVRQLRVEIRIVNPISNSLSDSNDELTSNAL